MLQQTPLSLTLYLKAPYLRQIRKKITPYLLRMEPELVQYKGKTIELADGHQSILVFIKDAKRVPIAELEWKVIDSLGYKSRAMIELIFQSLCNTREKITEITFLEVLVQPKKKKCRF